MTTDWECPQHGCTAPLPAHLATQADLWLKTHAPVPDPKAKKKR